LELATPEDYATEYRAVIRVGFNWNRFHKERWPIAAAQVVDRQMLGNSILPWYLGRTGQEVVYDAADATPIHLAQIPVVLASLNEQRQAGIQKYVYQFRSQPSVKFSVPSYDLGNSRQLALDGNHRLSALLLTDVPFTVTFWSVRGPMEADCLLDLIHWVSSAEPGAAADGGA
jgi:hypothetical protein